MAMTTDRLAEVESSVRTLGPIQLPNCDRAAWNIETYDFYGTAGAVMEKLDKIDVDVRDLRIYSVLVESATRSELRLIERETFDAEDCTVHVWSGPSGTDLHAKMSAAFLGNRGLHCSGEQLKAILQANVELRVAGTGPAPVSTKSAFAHTVKSFRDEGYLRVTASFMC